MAMTFEEAEALLTPAQQDALARCALEDAPLPSPLSEAQRVFCFGLSVLCEYEQRDEIFRYLLGSYIPPRSSRSFFQALHAVPRPTG